MFKLIKLAVLIVIIAVGFCFYTAHKKNTSVVDEALTLKHKVDSTIAIFKDKP